MLRMINGMDVHNTLRLVAITNAAPYKGQTFTRALWTHLENAFFITVRRTPFGERRKGQHCTAMGRYYTSFATQFLHGLTHTVAYHEIGFCVAVPVVSLAGWWNFRRPVKIPGPDKGLFFFEIMAFHKCLWPCRYLPFRTAIIHRLTNWAKPSANKSSETAQCVATTKYSDGRLAQIFDLSGVWLIFLATHNIFGA